MPRFNFRNSISALLGIPARAASLSEDEIDEIRESMLSMLGDSETGRFPRVTRRIRYATEASDLWFLRGDLMAALAELHGEAAAREQIASVTAQFQGLIPGGRHSRPSPLRD